MYDIAILNGTILDPLEGARKLDIGIEGELITALSSGPIRGKKVIDASGKFVSPGFIDIHMHSYPFDQCGFMETLNAMALMGVTTVLDGHCGLGHANFQTSIEKYRQKAAPVNYSSMIGHLSLRLMAGCSDLFSPAKKEEIEAMSELLAEGLQAGAPGLSFSLEYVPGTSIEEQIALSRIVADYKDRLVSNHYRFDADRFLEAIGEMIILARETGVKYQVSHIGSGAAFGQMAPALQMLEAANSGGVDIMADLYPYNSFMTAAGTTCFAPGCVERWRASYNDLHIVEGSFKGKYITPDILTMIREREPQVMVVASVMNEEEIKAAACHPLVMIASDGMLFEGQGHPRGAGAFPRFLGRYVREEGLMDWPAAGSKVSSMPAERLGLTDRGRIKEGFAADITIFDPELIIDCSTIEEPARPPLGISSVLVGGIEVVRNGKMTGENSGKFLRFAD